MTGSLPEGSELEKNSAMADGLGTREDERGGGRQIVEAEQEKEPFNGLRFHEGNPNSSETSWEEE